MIFSLQLVCYQGNLIAAVGKFKIQSSEVWNDINDYICQIIIMQLMQHELYSFSNISWLIVEMQVCKFLRENKDKTIFFFFKHARHICAHILIGIATQE